MKASRHATRRVAAVVGLGLVLGAHNAQAQTSFKLGDKEVQVHGSLQQGFATGTGNNFLTMETNDGSGAMTDAALNASTNLTRRFRVGGQVYLRNIGELGNGRVQLDWAYADYRFHELVGVRAGTVKTVTGLFNDTQDMEFLHTWALLPQGPYPLDLRSISIAHVGADVYGTVGLRKAGSVNYTAFAGKVPDDKNGGYRYGIEDGGLEIRSDVKNSAYGFDTRWNAPVDGLMVGYSFYNAKFESDLYLPSYRLTVFLELPSDKRQAFYADYQKNGLHVSAERRIQDQDIRLRPQVSRDQVKEVSTWFASASYRFTDWLEVGTYRSQYVADHSLDAGLDNNHVYDTVVTGRFDLNRFWNVKVEGHFFDGYGDPYGARGFYLRNNRSGYESTTKLLVVRTGVNF
jgi:hypothetical protein